MSYICSCKQILFMLEKFRTETASRSVRGTIRGSILRHVMRHAIEKGLGIECNTNRGHTPLPDAEILTLYRRLGGEIITLGSDAHTADYLGCAIAERQELLRSCGFRYFTTFQKGKPDFRPL